MRKVTIRIKKFSPDAKIPTYASSGASGADLYSIIDTEISPKGFSLVPTGISIEMPHNFEAQIRPRSGVALNYGVTILNTPGTIDADYRGEIKVILINLGNKTFEVRKGMRIAQMVFTKVEHINFEIVDELEKTERNDGGFGHSDE